MSLPSKSGKPPVHFTLEEEPFELEIEKEVQEVE